MNAIEVFHIKDISFEAEDKRYCGYFLFSFMPGQYL